MYGPSRGSISVGYGWELDSIVTVRHVQLNVPPHHSLRGFKQADNASVLDEFS
jgi:hypothetical protein